MKPPFHKTLAGDLPSLIKRGSLFLTIVIATIICQSCKEGCKDANATNNCSNCGKSIQGDCLYLGQVVFWYDSLVADSLERKYGTIPLTYKVIGGFNSTFIDTVIGTQPTYEYWPQPPTCDHAQSMHLIVPIKAGHSVDSWSYRIYDSGAQTIYSGNLSIEGGQCKSVQLGYP